MANKQIVTELRLIDSQYQNGLKKATLSLQQFASNSKSVGSSFNSMLGNLSAGKLTFAAVGAGAVALGKEMFDMAAKFSTVKTAYQNMTASMGAESYKLMNALKTATKGTVSELELMSNATTAMQLMGKEVVQYLPEMAEIATAAARAQGVEVSQMLSDLITAAGRQSTQILDNLGISSVTAGKYMEEYAAKLGKTRDQLNDSEKSAAFFFATMKAGKEVIKGVGDAMTLGEKAQQAKATWNDIANNISTILTPAWYGLADAVNSVLQPLADYMRKMDELRNPTTIEGIRARMKSLEQDVLYFGSQCGKTYQEIADKVYKGTIPANETWRDSIIKLVKEHDALAEKLKTVQTASKTPPKSGGSTIAKEYKEATISMSQFYMTLGEYQKAAQAKVYEEMQTFLKTQQAKKMTLEQVYKYEQQLEYQTLLGKVEAARSEVMMREQVLRAKMGLESTFFSGMEMFAQAGAQLMSSENKQLFKLGQVAAIANVWMNVAQAITKGYAQLGAWGGSAFAALMATVGAVQSANIMKQKPPQPAKIEKVQPVTPTLTAQPIAIPLAQGVFDIKNDTFALLHQGESVMPKSWAESVREGELSLGGAQIIVQGDVYGYDDFMNKVQTGLLELQRRTGKQIISARRGD